jgi:NodT family efflux transporter outer membrane factor (OMF) lipoprotein
MFALSLSGCAAAVHAPPLPQSLPRAYLASPPTPTSGPFWEGFGDPLLLQYLSAADKDNLDLAAAIARLSQARASASGSRAALAPELGESLSAKRQQHSIVSGISFQPRETKLFDAGIDATWELDIFSRLGNEARAARLDVAAADFDLRALRVTTRAETARLYYAVRTTQLRIAVLDRAAAAQSELASLARSRAEAGLVPESDALRAEGLAASSRATASVLRGDLADSISALALIMGRTSRSVSSDVTGGGALPSAPTPLLGAPADLLSSRPDVRRDLKRLQAADSRAAARARDRLPRLTLSATGGYSATTTAALFTPDAQVFSLGANLAGPVIDFGRRKSVSQQANALADERAANLQSTVLTAVREVERDAALLNSHRTELEARAVQVQRDSEVAILLKRRYLAGLVDFTSTLDADRTALASADAQILAEQAEINSAILLWKSIGGSEVGRSP